MRGRRRRVSRRRRPNWALSPAPEAHALRAQRLARRRLRRRRPGNLGDVELLDRYYVRSHFPPRDILTELGETKTKKPKLLLTAIAVLALVFMLGGGAK